MWESCHQKYTFTGKFGLKKNMVDMTTDVKLPWMLTCLILKFSCCICQSFSVTYTVLHWNKGSRLKREFVCSQSLSWLLKLIYLSNASELFLSRISSLQRERNLSCRLFTSSIKREIRHFPVVVVQWRQRNVQKSVMHVQSCCFASSTYCFFDVLVVVTVVAS